MSRASWSCSVSGRSEEETGGDDGEGKKAKRTGELLMASCNDITSHVFLFIYYPESTFTVMHIIISNRCFVLFFSSKNHNLRKCSTIVFIINNSNKYFFRNKSAC